MKTLRQYKKMVAFLSAHTQTHTLPYLIITGHTHTHSHTEAVAGSDVLLPDPGLSTARVAPLRGAESGRDLLATQEMTEPGRVVPIAASTPHGRLASPAVRTDGPKQPRLQGQRAATLPETSRAEGASILRHFRHLWRGGPCVDELVVGSRWTLLFLFRCCVLFSGRLWDRCVR